MGLKNLFKLKPHWEVRRTIWPYKDGYGVYDAGRQILLESGLSKEDAQRICDEENSKE